MEAKGQAAGGGAGVDSILTGSARQKTHMGHIGRLSYVCIDRPRASIYIDGVASTRMSVREPFV